MPKEVVMTIAEGRLSEGQARPLIGQSDDLVVQLVPRIINEEWSARKVEQYVVNLKKAGKQEASASKTKPDPHEADTQFLRKRFDTNISIQTNTKGAGKIVIPFKSSKDFERIKKMLG